MSQVIFKQSELNELINNAESGVALVNAYTRELKLTLYQLSNLKDSITQYMYSKIAKYDSQLDAIILSYNRLRIHDKFTIKSNESASISFTADIYTFKPKVGSVLSGIINNRSDDHVGCLVHRVFNIAIPRPNHEDQSLWIGKTLKIGQKVQFKVVDVELNEDMPYIKAELIDQIGVLTSDNYSLRQDGHYNKMEIDDDKSGNESNEDNKLNCISKNDCDTGNESNSDYDCTLVEYFLNEAYYAYRKSFSKLAQVILDHHKSISPNDAIDMTYKNKIKQTNQYKIDSSNSLKRKRESYDCAKREEVYKYNVGDSNFFTSCEKNFKNINTTWRCQGRSDEKKIRRNRRRGTKRNRINRRRNRKRKQ